LSFLHELIEFRTQILYAGIIRVLHIFDSFGEGRNLLRFLEDDAISLAKEVIHNVLVNGVDVSPE
jgi:hypothetical protein